MEKRQIILIVDDTPENLRVLGALLEPEYDVRVASNGADALRIAKLSRPDLILLDIVMPDMGGYAVCNQLKTDPYLEAIPVIFISALGLSEQKIKAFQNGAVDYITKPFQASEVLARVSTHLQLKLHQDNLQWMVDKQTHDLALAKEATIASMAIIAEFRDPETGGHIQRTKYYVKLLARELVGISPDAIIPENIELLYQSVPLHDIGKVGIPDNILYKQGVFTKEEFEEMKRHTLYGSEAIKRTEEILGTSSFLLYARELAECHHEKWDGTGYPRGLKGREIPFSARLMMLADIYDALISKRPYKKAFSHDEAYKIIVEGDGRTSPNHFDPDVLEVFKRHHLGFDFIAKRFEESILKE